MANYDLGALSPYDFELLIRDLFQEEHNVVLESFKKGQDGGIDLRNCFTDGTWIIQCKHYFKSPVSTLIRDLKKELPKVKKLNPDSYCVVTSCELSPQNKTEIFKIFSPYCKLDSDIYGREDIFNLLNRHEKIANNHYKLWFTSISVLEKILHSGIHNQTEADLEEFTNKLPKLIVTNSIAEVNTILEEEKICIISGPPGIGKSILMKSAVLRWIDEGYEAIKISENINEGFKLIKPDQKQIFYYDDFLGQTFLEKGFEKNEDERITLFLKKIQNTSNKRFILATREYILNQAILKAEKFDIRELNKYTLSLKDFTTFDKANILYHHLFFSEISKDNLLDLLDEKKYLAIINHPNFSPRIIEWMTFAQNVNSDNYLDNFFDALNNPKRIWESAFKKDITEESRYFLFLLSTYSYSVYYDTMLEAFKRFMLSLYPSKPKSHITQAFNYSIKELEGTFIVYAYSSFTKKYNIRFCNPSISDFIHLYCAENHECLIELFEGILTISQAKYIWEFIRQNSNYPPKNEIKEKYLSVLMRLIKRCEKSKKFASGDIFEDILLHLLELSIELKDGDFIQKSNECIEIFIQRITKGFCRTRKVYGILELIKNSKGIFSTKYETFLSPVKKLLLEDLPTYPSDFSLVIDYLENLDISFPPEEFQIFKGKAEKVLDRGISCDDPSEVESLDDIDIYCYTHFENNTYFNDQIGGIDEWYEIRVDIEKMENYFGVNAYYDQDIEEIVDEYERNQFPDTDNEVDRIREEKFLDQAKDTEDIDSLFDSLLEKS